MVYVVMPSTSLKARTSTWPTDSNMYATKSETCSVQYVVPQCSALGPILFILYTNDLIYLIP